MSNMKIKHKYKMDICKSGKLGIEKYKLTLQENHIYHIIFVDIEMPEMNGIEFTKIIRDFEKKSMLPKSYICGLITEEDTKFESFLEAGMDEFIKKPVNPSAMNDLIDRILVLKKDKKDNKVIK